VHTAVTVARNCHIIHPAARVALAQVHSGIVEWHNIDDPSQTFSPYPPACRAALVFFFPLSTLVLDAGRMDILQDPAMEVAITGKALSTLFKNGPTDVSLSFLSLSLCVCVCRCVC
jgi:hypothetical protein